MYFIYLVACYFLLKINYYQFQKMYSRRNINVITDSGINCRLSIRINTDFYIRRLDNRNKFYCKISFSLQIVSSLTNSSGLEKKFLNDLQI